MVFVLIDKPLPVFLAWYVAVPKLCNIPDKTFRRPSRGIHDHHVAVDHCFKSARHIRACDDKIASACNKLLIRNTEFDFALGDLVAANHGVKFTGRHPARLVKETDPVLTKP